jgi:hypothetical protein
MQRFAEFSLICPAFAGVLVAYEAPPSTSRAESLRRIWVFHETYATSAEKTKSSPGKSAA